MSSMDDDPLAGTRILVIGGDREAAESLRAELTAAGSSSVDLVPGIELVAAQAAAAQPEVVISLGDTDPRPCGRGSTRSGSTRRRPSWRSTS